MVVAAAEGKVGSKTRSGRKAASVGVRRSVRQLSRKRVISQVEEGGCAEKRQCGGGGDASAELSALESLPEEVLARVFCFMSHADLHQLYLVSKTIREAALVSKKLHFAYSTPPQIPAFRDFTDPVDVPEDDGAASPVAPPMQPRRRPGPRLGGRRPPAVFTALFTEDGADARPKRGGPN
uniref:F-box domain-containing protein n=1 Tax=Kalanchoe fedtschenkoi TaxID=63787 RepID=A0A7N0ULH2_KALFE